MQHMNTKRCGGHKGHWECADKYPDHILPVSEFNKLGDGFQGFCRTCQNRTTKMAQDSKPGHPITGQRKKNWKRGYATRMGVKPGDLGWQFCLDKAEEQWNIDVALFSNDQLMVPTKGVPPYRAHRKLPKVQRPKGKRVTIFKPDDPRGFVYVFKDHMKSINHYKVGASHNPQERLNQANTWGDFESVWESEMVDDCATLEKEVHQALSKYRVKGEWFQCDKTFIINKILELIDAREEQAMAEQKVS
jgi:hypothetical protein